MCYGPRTTSQPTRISHYRIVERLGAGGMGEVYAAVDETLQRRVALKAIRAEHRLSADAAARFLREARLLSQLDHHHICRVYDYVEESDGAWIVLELIAGRNLRQVITAGLDARAKLRIAEQIASVLVVTHAAGVVHRDLKPSNIMLTPSGDVKVLDFGLARSVIGGGAPVAVPAGGGVPDDDVPDSDVTRAAPEAFRTQAGLISGTLEYMSPEQAFGERGTTASDMYSYGLVLQELYTGEPPYDRSLHGVPLLARVRGGETRPVTGVATDVADLINRLKAYAPSQRLTAVDAAERLASIRTKPARRAKQAMAVAVVAAAVVGGVKYTIDLARERTIAVAARAEADRRRSQAENVIGFMLGDLRTKLQQMGRLDLLEDVGREATNYFKAVRPEDLSSEELYRRSQALYQLGQIRQAKGSLASAIESYRDSLSLIDQLARREPSNPRWQLGLVNAHFYVGDALRRQGDVDGSMQHMVAYKEVAERLTARDPTNVEWKMELSNGYSNVAAVRELKGDLRGAKADLDVTLRLKQEIADTNLNNVEWQQTLANTHNRIGLVLYRLGELRQARAHCLDDLAIQERLLAKQPANMPILQAAIIARGWVSILQGDLGDSAAADRQSERRFEDATRLAENDPANADWQREVEVARVALGDRDRFAGRRDLADLKYRTALAALTALLAKNPTRVVLRSDVAVAHARLGQAQACLDVLAPVTSKPPVNRLALRWKAECDLQRGDAVAALADVGRIVQISPDPDFLQIQARALEKLGRRAEASAVVATLNEQGYRNREFTSARKP